MTRRSRCRAPRRVPIARRALAVAVALLLGPAVRTAVAHPLHTTLTQLAYDASARVLNVTVRVFADDFGAAVMGRRVAAEFVPPDSAMMRYVGGRFALHGPRGESIPLRWCGMRREGEAMFLCLRAGGQPSPAGARMRNALLTEVFADQVNIVQASYGGAKRTLLFTPRDGMKPLP